MSLIKLINCPGGTMADPASCADWASRRPSECWANAAFMRAMCARACEELFGPLPPHDFARAEVCTVQHAGMHELNGFYVRAPGLMARRRVDHIFGKWPYILHYQSPASPSEPWAGFIYAPSLAVNGNSPYYYLPSSNNMWMLGTAGVGSPPIVRCYAGSPPPEAALHPSVERQLTLAHSTWGIEIARVNGMAAASRQACVTLRCVSSLMPRARRDHVRCSMRARAVYPCDF